MPVKQIRSFILSSSLSTDVCRIDFQFTDGTSISLPNLPPPRYAAAVATLQAVKVVYFSHDTNTNIHFLSTAPDAPGVA